MNFLFVDFETCSCAELRGANSVGLYNYANDVSTKALMLGFAINKEPADLWEIGYEAMPDRLKKALEDPTIMLVAFNSAFERYIFKYVLGIDLPIERFIDPQVCARYLSLPADLESVSEILGLPVDAAKDKEGGRLIDLFSKPHTTKKKKGVEPVTYFNNKETHPEDWKKFCDYCKQDILAEREALRRMLLLGAYPLPERECRFWIMDQRINDRGIPVDIDFVKKALKLAEREKEEAIQKQNLLTGLENSNSPLQMLEWARNQGYENNSLRKETVESELKYNANLTPLCKEVLLARKAASSTSYKKLAAILRQVCPDDRLRNQFIFMGSSRCGRWSGNAVQLHNMARPDKKFENKKNLNRARTLIYAEDYDSIKKEFGSVLLTVKSCLRTAFAVKKSKRFNVSDLNAIETRVAAWVCRCQPLLDVFLQGRDPYLDFAVKITQISYERLDADLHCLDPELQAIAKAHRQFAKPGVLGCVYRLGGGKWARKPKKKGQKIGDLYKDGLWGYAEGYGVIMTQEEAHAIVRIFRESYKEIPDFWYAAEDAVKDVLKGVKTVRYLGPNDCIKIDKINIIDRYPILRIQLPSGRYLHYIDARLEEVKMPWQDAQGEDVYKESLVYAGINQETKQWQTVNSNGGKILENIVQGIARDVLAESLWKFEYEMNLPVCAHVHDEGVCETDDDPFSPGVKEMEHQMSQPIDWAIGLPLKAEGFEDYYYHK